MAEAKKSKGSKISDQRKIKQVLKDTFGLKELRDAQSEVINSVLSGKHTLAIMPTGAGKSLCYQLPGQMMKGTTIVVSPLIALMKDQKEKLDDLKIGAVELNSAQKQGDQKDSIDSAQNGKTDFLYTTPERMSDPEFQAVLKKMKIDLFVIDEAHCLSQWGHDFRPSYLSLPEVWKSLGSPQLLALTATATSEVVAEIKNQFGLKQLEVIHSGVFRENLFYEAEHVENEDEKTELLLKLIADLKGSGIIYSATVKGVDEIFQALEAAGVDAVKYHGKMRVADRHEAQDLFMSGEVPLIVATNAFGMGIDKSDIRFVIHYHFAGSLESYYQESGRAGRDGKPARCILLYLKKDKSTQSFFLAGKYPSPDEVYAVYQALEVGGSVTIKELQNELSSIPKTKVKVITSALRASKVIKASVGGKLNISKKGLEAKHLESIFTDYNSKKENDRDKLKQMIVYAQSAMCRWKIVLNYFEQATDWEKCDHCDNCVKRDQKQIFAETTIPSEVTA